MNDKEARQATALAQAIEKTLGRTEGGDNVVVVTAALAMALGRFARSTKQPDMILETARPVIEAFARGDDRT